MNQNIFMARKNRSNGNIEDAMMLSRESGRLGGEGRAENEGGKSGNDRIEDTEIAARAYQIFEREGRTDGRDLEHWLQAEVELRSKREENPQISNRTAQPSSQASQATAPRSARLQQENQDGAGRPSAAESGLQSGMSGSR